MKSSSSSFYTVMSRCGHILLVMLCMLLISCGMQVQLQTLEPSQVNLKRGTSLRVASVYNNYPSAHLEDALYERLAQENFYTLGGSEAVLYIERAHVHQDRYINHTCHNSDHCHCTESVETTLTATVQLEYHGNILYRRTLSDTTYSDYADYDDIAVEVVRDLVPRTVRYSVRIKPQDGNTVLEQAVQACQQGDWNTGRALAEASLQTYPNDAEAYYLLGIIERNHRNFAASDAHFNRAYAIAPSSRYTAAIRENNVIKQKEDLAISQLNG